MQTGECGNVRSGKKQEPGGERGKYEGGHEKQALHLALYSRMMLEFPFSLKMTRALRS